MSIKALQEYTRVAKYARYNEKKRRRETWKEQVDRVMDMHRTHLGEEIYTQLKKILNLLVNKCMQKIY
jgi:hypothetical protein